MRWVTTSRPGLRRPGTEIPGEGMEGMGCNFPARGEECVERSNAPPYSA
jgi:hypothetical protein